MEREIDYWLAALLRRVYVIIVQIFTSSWDDSMTPLELYEIQGYSCELRNKMALFETCKFREIQGYFMWNDSLCQKYTSFQ